LIALRRILSAAFSTRTAESKRRPDWLPTNSEAAGSYGIALLFTPGQFKTQRHLFAAKQVEIIRRFILDEKTRFEKDGNKSGTRRYGQERQKP
jgi:hypothetical protein